MASLIIDTDPGVDDAFAIALAARRDDADLLAVTTVYGNVPLAATTRNACRVLALCGREDVPVAAGADRPLVHPHPHRAGHVHGDDGLSGRATSLPEPARDPEPAGAVELLARTLRAAREPVTVVPIGPLTTIALLLAVHPELADRIGRLVIMGGGASAGNVTATAEFNIWSDPEAARRVLVEERVPVTLVPLDLTYRCVVDQPWLQSLASAGPIGEALHGLTPTYRAHYRRTLGWDGIVLHDAVAVAEALRPGLLVTRPLPVDVDCSMGPSRGTTVLDRRLAGLRATEDREPPRTIDVAVDTDLDTLRRFVLTGLG